MELKELLNEENNFTYFSKNFSIKRKLNKYISKISFKQDEENFTYLGGVNLNFERSDIGVYKYDNNDIYFGNWNRNLKDGIGVFYSTSPFRDDSKKLFFNFYIGNWKCNTKHGNGIYLRLLLNPEINKKNDNDDLNKSNISNNSNNSNNESHASESFLKNISNNNDKKNNNTIKSNIFKINDNEIEKIEIFCGRFQEDEFVEGLNYLVSENNDEHIYYGRMNGNYEKEDDEGIMVTKHKKFIYKGKFKNDKFISGYVFNVNDESNKMFYVEYEDGEIIEFRNQNLIENYDEIHFEMITKFVTLNETEGFSDIKKYANLTFYYLEKILDFDFFKYEENSDFFKEHIFYFKDLFDNVMNYVI
jgi:hypothetical protein